MLENTIPKRVSLENWTKNHKTGQFEQVTKIKPATFMKGRAHIEVFDQNGNLEQEAVTENVINNSINKYFSKRLFAGLIGGYPSAATAYTPFGNIFLNNYTTAESASLAYIPEADTYPIIGWANKNEDYSGSDTKRGDVNKSETIIDLTTTPGTCDFKYVFDWNTDQANGTFQSIFWEGASITPTIGTVKAEVLPICPVAGSIYFNTSPQLYGQCLLKNGKLYMAQSGDVYETPYIINGTVYKDGFKIDDREIESSVAFSYSAQATTPGTYDGIFTDGTNFYILVVADNTIYKYNSAFVYQSSFSFNWATYMYDYALITGGGSNYFYTTKYISASECNIYKFDYTGALQATYNMNTATSVSGTHIRGIAFDGTNVLINYGNTVPSTFVISPTGSLITEISAGYSNDDRFAYMFDGDFKLLANCTSQQSGTIYDYSSSAPSAHTLLASPVTKTSANTMKITYTFSFDLTAL